MINDKVYMIYDARMTMFYKTITLFCVGRYKSSLKLILICWSLMIIEDDFERLVLLTTYIVSSEYFQSIVRVSTTMLVQLR